MPHHPTPRMPRTPQYHRSRSLPSRQVELCWLTVHRILRNGFEINYLHAMTSVQLGAELNTGVVLVISTGAKSVRHVKHTHAGISEGLKDMAEDGSEFSLDSQVPCKKLSQFEEWLLFLLVAVLMLDIPLKEFQILYKDGK
ncbi:hypothetical protein F5Y09DRAFT_146367 [Xylaria sp. FL1042]|nr:hypothetical protein F5Y09DRAFT_146367 [Xylaria sp. FL1042]